MQGFSCMVARFDQVLYCRTHRVKKTNANNYDKAPIRLRFTLIESRTIRTADYLQCIRSTARIDKLNAPLICASTG